MSHKVHLVYSINARPTSAMMPQALWNIVARFLSLHAISYVCPITFLKKAQNSNRLKINATSHKQFCHSKWTTQLPTLCSSAQNANDNCCRLSDYDIRQIHDDKSKIHTKTHEDWSTSSSVAICEKYANDHNRDWMHLSRPRQSVN
jgi:hypothetical protein